jgi:hypothetical protein
MVARLKPSVAKENGLLSAWTRAAVIEEHQLEDGTVLEFPSGSVWLDVDFDTKFDWPEYKWPEGSR